MHAPVADDRLARRNAVILAVAQALAGANSTVVFATGAIVGAQLAPSAAWATVPVSVFVLGMAFGTLPVGAIARRYGRRAAFLTGATAGGLTGLIACAAIMTGSFALYSLATFFGGFYAAVAQSYRFAAADTASDRFRPRAISYVMAGGVVAGVFGPQLIQHTMNFWPPYLFAASYLAQAAVAVIAMMVLAQVRIPLPPRAAIGAGGGRPLGEIVRQPKFIAAALCGVISYALMNLVMTSAPLAMRMCGHSLEDSNLAIQWHVIAMYGPSFFTGTLISRFGAPRVITVGLLLLCAAGIVDMAGVSVAHFWIGLILLGLGWNFGFVGASAMVTETCAPAERTRVQAFNDFLVFGTMALGSFSSGQILAAAGWTAVNEVIFPPAALGLALLLWRGLARRPA
ncbi:MFS transporter [Alsobacter soli]|uniref:MFS transporter n=1 Tax=Alsobacter soli TaxID=2109933 RepID=A0A2T1HXX4_9HYPH|nr:MFS transporter [Alsobacter soli]PSC06428.1 MFS transporter [Alsobacter soli]